MKEEIGLTQVYTGDGKGKTTAALGLALRAAGQGMKVIVIQFVKGNCLCGEHIFTSKHRCFKIVQLNTKNSFTQSEEELHLAIRQTLAFARKTILSAIYDMVILDEILIAQNKGLISSEQILDLIGKKPENMELILTGRGGSEEIIEKVDLVTKMTEVKHPFKKGIQARRGIEY